MSLQVRRRLLVALVCSVITLAHSASWGQEAVTVAKRGETHLNPANLPEIKPPLLEDDTVTIKLPEAASGLAVGGGGRYLILHLKSLRQLAVFDVNSAKVVKYLPVGSDDVSFTAGARHVVVVLRDKKIIQRWNLATFEKELTKTITARDSIATTVMGSASNGPIFVGCGSYYENSQLFLDLETLEPAAIESAKGLWRCSGGRDCVVRASANGRVLTMWRLGTSPSGLQDVMIAGNTATLRYEHDSVGDIIPNADGSLLYTGQGVFTSELQRVGTNQVSGGVPSVHGDFYLRQVVEGDDIRRLTRVGGGKLSIHVSGDTRPLVTVPNLLASRDRFTGVRTPEAISMLRHYFIPDADLLVTVPWTNDKLLLQRVDLDEALDKSGIDYLFVTSHPVVEAERGKSYAYSLKVKSKRGDVRYQVAAGPEGMKVSPAGAISWSVPEDLAENKVDVILSIRDASEQEVFQTFAIAVGGKVAASAAPREGETPPPATPAKVAQANEPQAAAKRPDAAVQQPPAGDSGKPKGLVLPRVEPVSFEGEQLRVKLPGSFREVAAAGGGRFLILHLAALRQLAVFDVTRAKVVKYLPLASDDVAFAAGSDRVIVALRDKKILQRWSLRSMERELAVPNPTGNTIISLAMGSASEGPVAAIMGDERAGPLVLLDGDSLELLSVGRSKATSARFTGRGQDIHVSANGRFFLTGGAAVKVVDRGADGLLVEQKTSSGNRPPYTAMPNADGTVIYSASGMFDGDLKRIGTERPAGLPIPSVQAGFYLSVPTGGYESRSGRSQPTRNVSIHIEGDQRPLVNVSLPVGLSTGGDRFRSVQRPLLTERFWFVPEAKAIVQLPASNDYLLVHRVDIDALLEKAEIDYLFVRSRPPRTASPGETLKYQMQVKSKRGGAKCTLASGPEGMQVSPEGLVSWKVPADFSSAQVRVIVSVKDDSNQEVFHSFSVALPEAAKREAERLAAEAARREAELAARRAAAMAEQNKARLAAALARADAALLAANEGAALMRKRASQSSGPRQLSPVRIWTDVSGNRLEASLLQVFAGQANFKKPSGQMIVVPVERLNDEDRKQVEQLAAAVVAERKRREAELGADDAKIRLPLVTIGLGLKNMAGAASSVRPPSSAGRVGNAGLSWRVHLLPFIGGRELYSLFRLDEPWDSEHNKALIRYMPDIYRAYGSGAGEGRTNFLGVRGENCLFNDGSRMTRTGVRDGLANTAAVVEAPDDQAVIWTRPNDWEFDAAEPTRGLIGLRKGGFYAVMGDGAVKFVSAENSAEALRGLFLYSDGDRAENLK
jgi:hypothetical protein